MKIVLRSCDFKNTPFLCFEKLLSSFRSMWWVIIHLQYEALSNIFFSIWMNLGIEYSPYTSELILIILSGVRLSINTSDAVLLAAIHAHAITLPSPCLMHDVSCFGSSLKHQGFKVQWESGIEPPTLGLKDDCPNNWTTVASKYRFQAMWTGHTCPWNCLSEIVLWVFENVSSNGSSNT